MAPDQKAGKVVTEDLLASGRSLNMLPFVSMPDRISILRLKQALRFRRSQMRMARAGLFIHNGDEIWSFTPLSILISCFDEMADVSLSETWQRSRAEATPVGANVLSWLLGKHFARYLLRFEDQGLFSEARPIGSRAYFRGDEGKPRTIQYLSRAVGETSRKVVIKRHGGRRPWFKNEGFGYRIHFSGSVWGVAIEPFYLFTGGDASKPVSYNRQTAYSKEWGGRDVKTGASHLAFWEDFLTGGSTADLEQDPVQTLLLRGPSLRLPQPVPRD